MSRPYTLLALLWGGAIFAGASIPVRVPAWAAFPHADKIAHAAEYAALAVLICKAFRHSASARTSGSALAFAVVITIAYGGALELYQWALPWRECSLADFAANCAGAGGAAAGMRISGG